MTNGMDPDNMTDAERLGEVTQMLAAGILRLRAKANSPRKKIRFFRDNCLEVPLETVPHAIRN